MALLEGPWGGECGMSAFGQGLFSPEEFLCAGGAEAFSHASRGSLEDEVVPADPDELWAAQATLTGEAGAPASPFMLSDLGNALKGKEPDQDQATPRAKVSADMVLQQSEAAAASIQNRVEVAKKTRRTRIREKTTEPGLTRPEKEPVLTVPEEQLTIPGKEPGVTGPKEDPPTKRPPVIALENLDHMFKATWHADKEEIVLGEGSFGHVTLLMRRSDGALAARKRFRPADGKRRSASS